MKTAIAHLRKLVALTGFAFLVATTTATFLTPQVARAECRPPLAPALPLASSERAPLPPPASPSQIQPVGSSPAESTPPEPGPGKRKGLVGTLNLNTATVDELLLLPGIGPAKAARIVAFRDRRGEFERVVDLRRVRGFGRKTVRRLLPYLTTDGETTLRRE